MDLSFGNRADRPDRFAPVLLTVLRLWLRRAATRRQLARLDAHLLGDIGLSPIERDAECRKWFWRE